MCGEGKQSLFQLPRVHGAGQLFGLPHRADRPQGIFCAVHRSEQGVPIHDGVTGGHCAFEELTVRSRIPQPGVDLRADMLLDAAFNVGTHFIPGLLHHLNRVLEEADHAVGVIPHFARFCGPIDGREHGHVLHFVLASLQFVDTLLPLLLEQALQ